ncbi:ATP-binding protein [uncultured Polaribacter sp.]|uniref:tetratricopeptide repeat-containing sensor histidine kinase n=1 Tax=uncultured Polaribacter sp. TaxID=174711 RepID=UPI002629A9DC|nr:ATP-binding protein [uncultured Polaribacter sp.]
MNLSKQPLLVCILYFFYASVIGQIKEDITKLHNEFEQVLFTDFNTAHKKATIAVSYSKKIGDKNLLLTSFKNLSEILYFKRENDSANTYNKKGISLALELENKKLLAKLYNLLGSIEKRKNNFTASLKYYEKALVLANTISKEDVSKIKNNLARLYWATNEKQNAKIVLQEVIKNNSTDKNNLADAYNILGVIFLEKNKDSSLIFYKKAYALINESNNKYLKSIITSNLGHLYIYLKAYKKAFQYLKQSEQISKQIGNSYSLHHINISLGIYYERQGDLKNALKKYTKAIEEFGSFVDDYQKSKAYWTISGVLYHLQKYKEAYLYLDTFLELNERILSLEKKKEFEKIRTQYEVEKKENQIVLLEKENEVAEIRKRNILIIFISVLTVVLVLLLFYKNRFKNQKKIRTQEKKLFKSQKEKREKELELEKIHQFIAGQEKEKNRIALELHDGIGGKLAGIKHILNALNSDVKNLEIIKITKNINSITHEVRLLSHTLSSHYILNTSFVDLILELKNTFETSKKTKINISIYPENCINILNNHKKHQLYRVLQELINNSYTYSKSKTIDISFTCHKEYISLIVEDKGIGFDLKKKSDGIGFKNIKDRISSMNGTLHIDATIDRGTLISIEIPNE